MRFDSCPLLWLSCQLIISMCINWKQMSGLSVLRYFDIWFPQLISIVRTFRVICWAQIFSSLSLCLGQQFVVRSTVSAPCLFTPGSVCKHWLCTVTLFRNVCRRCGRTMEIDWREHPVNMLASTIVRVSVPPIIYWLISI